MIIIIIAFVFFNLAAILKENRIPQRLLMGIEESEGEGRNGCYFNL